MTLAFSTGLDSFMNPEEIGPMYPFAGAEWVFVAIGVVIWLLWHAAQIRGETSENREAIEMYERIGLDRAMYHGGSALIATDEEWDQEIHARREASPARGHAGGQPPPPR